MGQKPTLSFRYLYFANGHIIDLIDLFPLKFPYRRGGPNIRRATHVSDCKRMWHYSCIILPCMQESRFLLELCSTV